MNEYIKYYKNIGKISAFITLIINKTSVIIIDKINNYLSTFMNTVNGSDLILIKKKSLIWNELLKNYITFMTSLNNLMGEVHVINYTRKNIVREIFKDKNKEYLEEKLELLIKSSENFIKYIRILLITIDYFSKIFDQNFQKNTDEIRTIKNIYTLIENTIEIFEKKYLLRFKNTKEHVFEILTKNGSSEELLNEINQNLFNFNIQGGFEEKQFYYIRLGGADIVGGFHIQKYIEQQYILYQLLKNDEETIKNKSSEFIINYYQNYIPQLNKYILLSNIKNDELFIKKILLDSNSLDNIYQQLLNLISRIPELLNYHVNRFNISHSNEVSIFNNQINSQTSTIAKINYQDEFKHISKIIQWDPENPNINILIETILDILKIIDLADHNFILKTIKKSFKQINEIQSIEEFEKIYQEVIEDFDIINKNRDFNSRAILKQKINQIIKELQQLSNHSIKLDKIIKVPLKNKIVSVDTKDIEIILKNLKYLTYLMEYILNYENNIRDILNQFENYYDQLTDKLNNLNLELDNLINPDNIETCIKKPLLIINTYLRLILLQKISHKRFMDNVKIQEIQLNIQNILEKLDFSSGDIYDSDGLNFEKIKIMITQYIGQIIDF